MGKCNQGVNHPKFIDLTGQIFGKLKILEYVQVQEKHGKVWKWKTQCECGNNTFTRTRDFTKEKPVISCKNCAYKRGGLTSRLPGNQTLENRLYRQYLRGAKSRGYSFNLTKEEMLNLFNENCHYCNDAPKEYLGEKVYNYSEKPYLRNGIDRMNNSLDYTKENTVTCCQTCNKAKMEMDYQEFLDFIAKVYNNINK